MAFLSAFTAAAWRAFVQAAAMLVVGVAAIAIVSFLSDDPLTMFFRPAGYASVAGAWRDDTGALGTGKTTRLCVVAEIETPDPGENGLGGALATQGRLVLLAPHRHGVSAVGALAA